MTMLLYINENNNNKNDNNDKYNNIKMKFTVIKI